MSKLSLITLALPLKASILVFAMFSQFLFAQEPDPVLGKKLFNSNCAACHKVNKKAVGPALRGASTKYEKEWLYSWIKNSSAMIKSGDDQAVAIWEEYNKSAMTAFPQLSTDDIDNIIAYTDYIPPAPAVVASDSNQTTNSNLSSGIANEIILGALGFVFIMLILFTSFINDLNSG